MTPRSYSGEALQNTDPFVYGDRFHYTFCQQHTKRGPTLLRNLDRGSVILFGSCRSKNHFVIDTVFVVKDWIDYDRNSCLTKVLPHIDPTYAAVSFSPFWKHNFLDPYQEVVSAESPGPTFRLYNGATLDDPVDGMFSFFPCLQRSVSDKGFERPTISIDGAITCTLFQGKKGTECKSIGKIKALWETVVTQVRSRGLELGVSAVMPPHQDSPVLRQP